MGDGCFHKLTFQDASGKVLLYLTPDQRFLTRQLYDLKVDPTAAIREANARVQGLLLAQPSPSRGTRDAPVVLVEFGDFQCPFCRNFERQLDALPQDLRGKVRVVFKHFPLPEHAWARKAASLAACASAQSEEAFWALHDALYREQDGIGEAALRDLTLRAVGKVGGVDPAVLSSCAADHAQDGIVERDIALGERLNVNATPTVFLNGERLPPAISSNGLLAERVKVALADLGARAVVGSGNN